MNISISRLDNMFNSFIGNLDYVNDRLKDNAIELQGMITSMLDSGTISTDSASVLYKQVELMLVDVECLEEVAAQFKGLR
jgi:hypothetical protein